MDDFDGELEDEKALTERVGYASPPKGTRWKPGQSGNPQGRPKNRKTRRAMLAEIALRDVSYQDGGRSHKTNVISAILRIVKNKAIVQNASAAKLIDQLLDCYIDPNDDQPVPLRGVLIVGERLTSQEWTDYYTPERIAEINREASAADSCATGTGIASDLTRDRASLS